MSDDNRISAEFTETAEAAVMGHIAAIRALMPFLINLTPEERQEMPKLGDKTLAFDEKCKTHMEQNPAFVPGFIDVAEVNKDRELRKPVNNVERALKALSDSASDTSMLTGAEIYMADLAFYQNVRQAAKRGKPNAQTVYDDLKSRFPGGGGGTPPPANPPSGPTP